MAAHATKPGEKFRLLLQHGALPNKAVTSVFPICIPEPLGTPVLCEWVGVVGVGGWEWVDVVRNHDGAHW